MKLRVFISLVALMAILLSSCLTAQYKEYKFEFDGKTSGTLTVTHRNIYSTRYDDEMTVEEEMEEDYQEIMDDYINGTTIEDDYPNAKVVSKKMFEENHELCGEIVLKFDAIEDVNLYKYSKKAPYMFYLDDDYFDSNGEKGPEYMPVVIWDKKAKVLEVTVELDTPDEEETISLLNVWKKNK